MSQSKWMGELLPDGSMERINVAGVYELGSYVHPLIGLRAGMTVTELIRLLAEADRMLSTFLSTTFGPKSDGARQYAEALRAALQTLTVVPPSTVLIGFQFSSSKVLSEFEASNIRKLVEGFENAFYLEMPRNDVFYVTTKGIADTRLLIEKAENDFEEPIRSALPQPAIEELRQGGKARAFELDTASAIHAMRAAEIVLLALLRQHKIAGLKKSERNWGNYLKLLHEKKIDEELHKFLDELARFERNETLHPTKLLSPAERDKIYTVAKGAIIVMQTEIMRLQSPTI
jgi:hypothetical protein